MCGRFTLSIDGNFQDRFQLSSLPSAISSKYSAYPGANVPVIISNKSQSQVIIKNWGLGVYKSFNARSETILEKPTFARAFTENRCLVPVNGFYEGKKFFTLPDQIYFSLAGIFDGEQFTILTTEPNDIVRPFHHRMPVIIPRELENSWFTADIPTAQKFFTPSLLNLQVH